MQLALPNSAAALLNEANRLSFVGNWDAARPLYSQAEALFKSEGNRRGEIYARVGRIRSNQNESNWEEVSHSLDESLHDPAVQSDDELRLWCLVSKGYVDLDLNTSSAKESWTEALPLAERLDKSEWATRARGELGVIAFLEGDTAKAVSLVGRALLWAFANGDIGEQVRLLSMLGNGYNEVHRYTEALGFFRHAISIAETNRDAGIPFMAYDGEATALIGLGSVDAGIRRLDQTLAKARSVHRRTEEAQALVLLGEGSVSNEQIALAKNYFQQGARISQENAYYRPLAEAEFNLAALYRREGDLQSAAASLSIGLKASQRTGDKYYLPRDLTALAEVNAAQGNVPEANLAFTAAEDVMEALLINAHSHIASRAMAEAMSTTYLEHFRLLQEQHDVSQAFFVLERLRIRTAAITLHIAVSDTRTWASTDLEKEIAKLQLTLLQTDDERARSNLMDKLLELERTLAYQRNESALDQGIIQRPVSLNQMRQILRPDEMFVEYVPTESALYCVVITREDAHITKLAQAAGTVRNLILSYTDAIKSKRTAPDLASELYAIFLQPILRPDKPQLIIVPDQEIRQLPFEALRTTAGEYAANLAFISYMPSATELFFQRTFSAHSIPPQRSLLAVGDVDYGMNAGRSAFMRMVTRGIEALSRSNISELPETRKEVLAIAGIAGEGSKILLGRNATEAAFKAEPLGDFRIIHLAVHALSDANYPERASLVLGIASASSDDGLLQVREIAHLQLNADLVTLSACQTGVGGHAGVYSLQEAFLLGGAKTVVAALWNVEDHSTTLLMQMFYEHLARGEPKTAALTNAKRQFISQFKDRSPYYWAGFVMLGDGASALQLGGAGFASPTVPTN